MGRTEEDIALISRVKSSSYVVSYVRAAARVYLNKSHPLLLFVNT